MASTAQLRAHMRWLIAALVIIGATVVMAPNAALANIAELSASVTGPTPSSAPTGSSASVSADFWVSSDAGPITVGITLDTDPGFEWGSLDSTSAGLTDCLVTLTSITCDWDGTLASGTQTIAATIDVASDAETRAGGEIVAIAWSDTENTEAYATSWIEAVPPDGTTSISGSVITTGGTPVAQACIFVLSSNGYVFNSTTDDTGNWSVTGLPDDWSFAVAAIGPFSGAYGPCASDGPPPVPGDGELQPVFYDDVWADLANPLLTGGSGNPYDFAVSAGAHVFADSASGIVFCLTTASGATIPRPACVPPATTTTTSSTTSTIAATTTTSPTDGGVAGVAVTTPDDTLPVTGASTTAVGIVGALLLLLGLGLLRATRPRAIQTPQN